jgi:lysophospholipase L1-like esterase
MRKAPAIAIELSLVLGSILVFLLFCEFVAFRFLWLASDAPRLAFANDLVRYAPHQEGVWRIRNEVAAAYRINGQGWNSGIGDYQVDRRPSLARIALVGDSYVEALQVASTDSAAELLGRKLEDAGQPTEVYRFGISGAPLSQYVHMVEREVARYRPDWIVVILAHNDLGESFQFQQGRYTSSFLKFRVENGTVTGELPPAPWRPGTIEALRETATARFFLYRWRVRPQAIVDLFLPRPAGAGHDTYVANVDIGSILSRRREVEAVANHAVTRLRVLAAGIDSRLLMVMDGDRQSIYRGAPSSPALELNRIMAVAAGNHVVEFLDLHPIFAAHWQSHRERFEFDSDGHWNELGHSVVAAAIVERIRREK